MKRKLFGVVVGGLFMAGSWSVATAAEPMQLSADQMDSVTAAGHAYGKTKDKKLPYGLSKKFVYYQSIEQKGDNLFAWNCAGPGTCNGNKIINIQTSN